MEKLPVLSIFHKKFADSYIRTGRASESARQAGTKSKNPEIAGYQLLQRDDIKSYIRIRREQINASDNNELIADMKEIKQFLTNNIREESIPDKDRIKSAELLAKLLGGFDKKNDLDLDDERVVIIDDLLDEDNESVEGDSDD